MLSAETAVWCHFHIGAQLMKLLRACVRLDVWVLGFDPPEFFGVQGTSTNIPDFLDGFWTLNWDGQGFMPSLDVGSTSCY